ncbi:unnamed protein product [Rhizophagus irregularis]|nr:unnamed protein product [Rhizophagus irregularis]
MNVSALGWASEVQKSKDSFGTRVGFRSTEIQRFVGSRVGGASEFRRTKKNQDSFGGLPILKIRKEPRFAGGFRRIDEPRFFRHSILERWIYGFDFRLGFGYMDFGSWILDIWVSTFGWALDIWVSTFSWALDIWVSYEVSTFGWALDIWVRLSISFSSRAFGYIDFDFRFLGFG